MYIHKYLFRPRPQINVKKPYCQKSRVERAKKPAADEKILVFASRFSNFPDSFNHIKTAFRDGSIKLSIFNAKLYYVHYLCSLKFLKSINKSVFEKKFVNYFMSKKISIDER